MNITTNIPVISKLDTISLAIEGLREIGKIIFAMAKIVGVIKPEVDIQQIGDKAIQAEADGIMPETYDTFSDYVEALNDYIVDPEKSQRLSEEIKEIKGVEIAICLMIEKFADTPISSFIESIIDNPADYKDGRIEAYSEMINKDKKFIADFVGYISGSEKNYDKFNEICDTLIDIEKRIYPEISEKEAYKRVMQLRS